MSYDSCSFTIGDETLQRIEQEAKLMTTPLTSKIEKPGQIQDPDEEVIIEESPNAKENFNSVCQLSLHERLRHATQRGRNRRNLEKSKSNPTILMDSTNKNDLTSISKYLRPEEIDFSSWENSAAKLISPAVQRDLTDYENLKLDCSASQELFDDHPLDQAINADISVSSPTVMDEVKSSFHDTGNVTFMHPLDDQAESCFEDELRLQKSIMKTFANESILNTSNALTIQKPELSHSLVLDPSKDLRFMSNWNLPASVVNEYRKKNLTEMFEWQCECLKNPKVLFDGSNLVYSAPTSAGKTLVSEILMIKNIVERRKKALFVLPFVSVVREKMFYLQDLIASSGLRVEGFFGGYNPPGGFDSIDLAVCTIEKANSIVNRLLEQDKLSDVGVIVIDEVHLISDASRGYILELLLTKILYMCEKFQHKIQIVTMSATLPNVDLLRRWLKAEFYSTDFRPIELREMIKIGRNIFDHRMKHIRAIGEKFAKFFPNDTDEVCELAMETIMENCQLIIFCPTKAWCEDLCTNLARGIHQMFKTSDEAIREIVNKQRVANLLEQVKSLPSGADHVLQRSLPYGCAFHHAGLTTDERDLIEMGFRDGTIKVLVATSTLSSGVNLPARRVIIRTPMFGKAMMSNLTYRQMIGRAGRKGKDVLGESILVCNDATSRVGKLLVVAPLDPISSCLDVDSHSHLKRALLEIIASGVVNTKRDLESFINATLFCHQHSDVSYGFFQRNDEELKAMPRKLEGATGSDPIESSMDFLLEYEFIRIHVDDEANEIKFVPTRLGLACLASSLPPKDGFWLFSELQKSRQNFVLESELHAIYLVTPFSVAYQLQNIDWRCFAEMHDMLPDMMKRVGAMVGVSETYLLKAIMGKQGSDKRAEQIHKRFYTALALQELVNEVSMSEVSAKYKIPRGMLQNLQQMAATFAGIVTTFCKSLQWNLLALILAQFRERLFFGIHPDLIDLMKIPSMSSTRTARALHKSGIEKLSELANCKLLQVENVLMDLGGSFFVVGKSMDLSVQEVAKLMISDARSHIQKEIGLNVVKWSQEATEQSVGEVQVEHPARVEPPEPSKDEAMGKRKKVDLDSSVNYRKKLRSSGGAQDFVTVDTQFMADLDKKAEVDDNESLFRNQESVDESTSLMDLTHQHLKVVDVLADEKVFELFQREVQQQTELSMSVGVQKFEIQSQKIGGNLLKPGGTQTSSEHAFTYDGTFFIDCISFCYNENRVCFLNLQKKDPNMMRNVRNFVMELLSREDATVTIYEAREHLKVLQKAFGTFDVNAKICDPRLASWLMDPDTNLSWQQLVEKFAPEQSPILELATKHSTVSSFGLCHLSRVEPKVRTAVESFLSCEMMRRQLKMMKSVLARVFRDLEMKIQVVLMRMEISGFPINPRKLQQTIENSTLLQRQLEQHIYKLNGRKFNLSSSKEVSKVVGIHRGLVEKKKVSTAKCVLEKLDLPIGNAIMTWRTLTKTISNIQPMMKLVKNGRIHATSFSLTQTGRISMYEPNLQNVTKDFRVEFNDPTGAEIHRTVSFRRVFECREGKVLLSADFCQLELRILTHLCKDSKLVKVMNTPGEDIFKQIAAKWNKVEVADVTDGQRNQTKQLCYGIIYGMGNKALAESMKVDEETSAKLAEDFHATYPGIKQYAAKVVHKAREQGFIETVTCRRRFLPAIKSENSSERSQAERQALNTCIQGSASDLVKNAILRMDRNLRKQNLIGCDLVLHLHDELFYEVPEKHLKEAAKILIQSMQNCVKLNVPLLVKLKSGGSWGEMKDL